MRTRAEIIEELDITAETLPYDMHGDCDPDLLYEASMMLAQEWISVDDRLPNCQDRFLVRGHAGYVGIDWLYDVDSGFPERKQITHWQPLPAPPKETT